MATKKKKDASSAKPRNLDLAVRGYSGLKEFGGVVDEEFLPRLRGAYGVKTYREMLDNSSTVGAIFYLLRALVRQVEWRVEPASTEKAALDWAEFLEGCLLDMSHTWEDLISEVLSSLGYGWAYFETVYKIRRGDTNDSSTRSQFDDGKIGWRKFALRPQDSLERWQFSDEDDGLEGMIQLTDKGKRAFIPIEKAILFRTETTKGNPQGRSVLRNAVTDWYYLKRISNIEAVGIERDLTGLPKMEVPEEILAVDAPAEAKSLRAQLEKMLGEIKRDERDFALVPSELDREGKPTGYKLSLLTTGGTRQFDTNAVKLYYKVSILQSVLAQFIQLGMDKAGSWALASSHTDTFVMALGAHLGSICSTFNRFAVARLMKLNNAPREFWPALVHGDIESPPLAEIGAYIQALATTGQLPDDEAIQRKLLEFARLPIPEAEDGEVHKSRSRRARSPRVAPMRGVSLWPAGS